MEADKDGNSKTCSQNKSARQGHNSLKGHSQLMHMHIRYHFLTDLHITRYPIILFFDYEHPLIFLLGHN